MGGGGDQIFQYGQPEELTGRMMKKGYSFYRRPPGILERIYRCKTIVSRYFDDMFGMSGTTEHGLHPQLRLSHVA